MQQNLATAEGYRTRATVYTPKRVCKKYNTHVVYVRNRLTPTDHMPDWWFLIEDRVLALHRLNKVQIVVALEEILDLYEQGNLDLDAYIGGLELMSDGQTVRFPFNTNTDSNYP